MPHNAKNVSERKQGCGGECWKFWYTVVQPLGQMTFWLTQTLKNVLLGTWDGRLSQPCICKHGPPRVVTKSIESQLLRQSQLLSLKRGVHPF